MVKTHGFPVKISLKPIQLIWAKVGKNGGFMVV
jgi:hypothetical protein